jgi:hypothetical protein
MTNQHPCAGCLYETPSCSLVGECREKKLAALRQAEKEAQKKPKKIINFNASATG